MRKANMGVIEVDMFEESVDSPAHPEALKFRQILEEVADEYNCSLNSFSVEKGTVSFSFDSDLLMADVIKVLRDGK
ncbi:MAG: hypothetical protein CO107_01840 [Deltaproteobacteria bacterium CG_4_9_14_3_um_filter_51_14]|nr:MAG: hypothetical protein AUK25_04170 [Desulfobacteraceae bacterium CG2_30_51_40]PJB38648.1 MAG: hypothetical protein CO107_01840 [Deltaproteobacteria bacterium CG_4_9_14_3_um_filter_51_14]